MNSLYKELSSAIMESDDFNSDCDCLFNAYISKSVNKDYNIDGNAVKNLATSIQYFYLSDIEEYKSEGAILLSMLLNVVGHETKEIVAIANTVFSQSGDFPNVNLLNNLFPDVNFKSSFFEETIKDLRENLNTVKEIDHPLTDYQRSLWSDLTSEEDIITSAPTSTGKTHIILRYLLQELMKSDGAFAAVVVPTRALISELSGKLYEIAKDISFEKDLEICTFPKKGVFKGKTFFVMTQERLFEVLQDGDIRFDYLFIDEAHNISDKSRGVLLHLTLQKVLESSTPQIIISMPSPRYLNAFDSVFEGIQFSKFSTKHSPVSKILMPVRLMGRKIQISRLNKGNTISIDKGFKGTKPAAIAYRLGQGECNIVYRNQPNHCEIIARDIAGFVPTNKNSPNLEEAADYIEQFLHQEFSLADNLRKGVAFHYGPLPSVVRKMVEDLASKGELDYIACTSTLSEGVNLPAKNLFLNNPTQITPRGEPNERLDDVKLANITGRAGRMLKHFAGNIFLIESENWTFKDYFEETEEEIDKIPTYFKVLNEDFLGVVAALRGSGGDQTKEQFTHYTIANKLIKEFDRDTLHKTLDAKELTLSSKQRQKLEESVVSAYDSLEIDTFTLEANPTVGYIQQNNLYMFLGEQDDLEEWVLPHPKLSTFRARIRKICDVLFENGIYNPSYEYNIGFACLIASKWIRGHSLKSIIASKIKYDKQESNYTNCNSSVREVIKTIDSDVRFKMSSALRCYHSLITPLLALKEGDLQSMKIHPLIEIGGCGERYINLANFGLSRETSLEIDRVLPNAITVETIGDLRGLYEENKLDSLHAVTFREITNLLM